MANVDRIESLINVPVIKQEVTDVLAGLGDVKKFIDDVGRLESLAKGAGKFSELTKVTEQLGEAMKKNEELAKRLKDANDKLASSNETVAGSQKKVIENDKSLLEVSIKNEAALKALRKQRAELDNQLQAGAISQAEYTRESVKLKEAQVAISVSQTQVTATLKNLEKENQAASGSVEKLRAQLNLALTAFDKLSGSEKSSDVGQGLINQINKLTAAVSKEEQATGRFQRNVGNYQGSAKIIVDAMERARTKVAEVGKAFGPVSPEAQAARKEFETLDRITQNPQFLNISAKVGDTNKELRFFQQQLNGLEDAGLRNSEVYREIQTRLAKLTDQIGDTRAEIKAMSSDSRSFDLFAGSVSFAADAFQTFAGAAVLAGASQESVEETTQTLIAVQSVANGVKGVANELTTKGTAANKAYNYVLALGNTLFGKGTTAAQRFGAAVKGIGLILLVTVIIEVVQALGKFVDKAEDAKDNLKKLNDEIERNKKLTQDLAASDQFDFTKQIDGIKLTAAQRSKFAKSDIEQQRLDNETKKELYNAEVAFRADQLKKLRVQKENADEDLLREEIRQNQFRLSLQRQGINEISKDRVEADRAAIESLKKNQEERVKAIQQGQRDLITFQENSAIELAQADADKAKEDAKKAKERADSELQVQLEIRKIQLQQLADFSKEVVDNEKETDLARLFSLNQYMLARKEIIDRSAAVESKVGTKTASELKLIEEKRIDEIVRLAHEGEASRIKIVQSEIQERSKMTDDEKKILADKAAEIAKNFEENEKKKREAAKKTLEERKKIAEEEKELQKRLYDELTTTLTVFFTAGLERRKNDIQEQIDLIDVQREKEVEAASQSVGTEQERSDKIAVIEATANNKKRQLEREQRRIQQEQAKFQKAAQIVKIIGDTAAAIMATLAKTPPPAGLPLALLTGAIGAAQLAAVIAQPIPKYAKGTGDKDHPGGLAVVGDGGKSEGVKLPDGTILKTPSTATLVDLPKGSQVFPDFTKMVLRASLNEIPDVKVMVPFDKTERAIQRMEKSIVKSIKDKQENHWHMPGRYETFTRDGSKFRAYLNKNL